MKQIIAFLIPVFLLIFSCQNESQEKNKSKRPAGQEKKAINKPPSNYQDTLKIDFTAAVFYHPDSMQLQSIKELVDSGVFEATMHEFFFQMRNARLSIKKDWPHIQIVEAKNVRYLSFWSKKSDTVIDLDKKNDPYGLFLFQPGDQPHVTDMMNIDTELGFYFKK